MPLHIEKGRTHYSRIQFRIFDEGAGGCDHIGETLEHPDGKAIYQIDLSLRRFIRCLQRGIDCFLEEHPEMNEDNGSESFFYQPLLDFRGQSLEE